MVVTNIYDRNINKASASLTVLEDRSLGSVVCRARLPLADTFFASSSFWRPQELLGLQPHCSNLSSSSLDFLLFPYLPLRVSCKDTYYWI